MKVVILRNVFVAGNYVPASATVLDFDDATAKNLLAAKKARVATESDAVAPTEKPAKGKEK